MTAKGEREGSTASLRERASGYRRRRRARRGLEDAQSAKWDLLDLFLWVVLFGYLDD